MRIALLSDTHGNLIALDAVLADVLRRGGVDAYWVVGDVAAVGYDPVGVIERLVALPRARFVRGNTDRYTVTGAWPMRAPSAEDVQKDPAKLHQMLLIARSFAWTRGAITQAGWFDWLAGLPLEQRQTLPDGTRMLAVHAAPGCDDGPGITSELGEAELEALVAGCKADLVFVGHTHRSLDCFAGPVRTVNIGSVSNPVGEDPRASYAVLEVDTSGHHIEYRQVEYDRRAVIREIARVRHPAASYLMSFMNTSTT